MSFERAKKRSKGFGFERQDKGREGGRVQGNVRCPLGIDELDINAAADVHRHVVLGDGRL
jgi:hypothetical protein